MGGGGGGSPPGRAKGVGKGGGGTEDVQLTRRQICIKGFPLQAGQRWVVERTQAWMNGFGKLRRCTEQARHAVDFYLFLAATFVVTRCLIQRARTRYRWPGRPTTRRLR